MHGQNLFGICNLAGICQGSYVGLSSVFFANQNFSGHRKAELLCKWIVLVLQVKFRFRGCQVKVNTLMLGNR